MIIDELGEFCDATALNTGAADANYFIGSAVDSVAVRDLGNGQPVYCVITVDTEVDSSSDGASVEFMLRSDDSSTIHATTSTIHASTGAIAEASLTQGASFSLVLPVEGVAYERYIGIVQRTTGEAVTAGKVNAFLTIDPYGWKAYPEGGN